MNFFVYKLCHFVKKGQVIAMLDFYFYKKRPRKNKKIIRKAK